MVRYSSDWNSLSAMVSTSWLLSHGWREAGYSPPLFNKYILSVTASLYMFHWTMTVPMSCIMSILNGEAGFILEIIVCNGLHKLTFESWISLQLHCSNVSLWVYWKVRYSSVKCTHWTLALCPHLLLLLDTIKHNYREKQVVCGAKNCGVLNLRAFKPQTPSGKTDCPPGMAA